MIPMLIMQAPEGAAGARRDTASLACQRWLRL
jgi:hypothetical protein